VAVVAVPPSGDRRAKSGALLGAVAGPPLVILGAYPLIAPRMAAAGKDGTAPLWLAAVFLCFAAGVVGLPLLGASVASGTWLGRTLGRRLANHCIGGGMAGGMVAGLLLRAGPALRSGDGMPLRLVLMEVGLVAGVLLCFRGGKSPPPA
jgi:hypothetical protein